LTNFNFYKIIEKLKKFAVNRRRYYLTKKADVVKYFVMDSMGTAKNLTSKRVDFIWSMLLFCTKIITGGMRTEFRKIFLTVGNMNPKIN